MEPVIEKTISSLAEKLFEDDFLSFADDLLDDLSKDKNSFDAVEPLLRLIENNESVDFGDPGPFVHFVEKFYKKGYEPILVDSIRRKPVLHTIWMLNRIINGSDLNTQKQYLKLLDEVINRADLTDEVKECARDFKSLHV